MYWDSIIGQEKVIKLLQRSIESRHVAHAYLFHGVDGCGKRAVAFAFAQALQCGGDDRIHTMGLHHPDIEILIPEPNDAKAKDVANRISMMSKDPYAAVDFIRAPTLGTKKNEPKTLKRAFYSVEQINQRLRKKMVLRPSHGKYRIAIITDVDTIREEAANAFLKLLEEPGPDTLFILTTCRKDTLLPTILSRCQHVAFKNLPANVIAQALQKHKGVATDLANLAANMSNGSYTHALELTQSEELRTNRERVLTFLRLAFQGKIGKQADLINEIRASGRDGIRNTLQLLLGWVRDVILYRTMGDDALVANQDQIQEMSTFNRNLQNADLHAMSRLIEEALFLTESNVNTNLLLINLSFNLGNAMRAPHSGKLTVPLTKRSY